MAITPSQKRYLRSKAHNLKPVVTVGQHGLSDNVMAEIEIALAYHELVKIKISGADRDVSLRLNDPPVLHLDDPIGGRGRLRVDGVEVRPRVPRAGLPVTVTVSVLPVPSPNTVVRAASV